MLTNPCKLVSHVPKVGLHRGEVLAGVGRRWQCASSQWWTRRPSKALERQLQHLEYPRFTLCSPNPWMNMSAIVQNAHCLQGTVRRRVYAATR